MQLETAIDDMSPEYLGTDFQEGLLHSGAIDFGIVQLLMKKGRFDCLLRVTLPVKELESVSNYIFDNTSTIGLRYYNIDRLELQRQQHQKKTSFGEVRVKQTITPTNMVKIKPEFEDIKKLANETKQSPFQIINNFNSNPLKS